MFGESQQRTVCPIELLTRTSVKPTITAKTADLGYMVRRGVT